MASDARLFQRGQGWLRETSWSYLFGLAFFLAALALLLSIGAEAGSVRATLVRSTRTLIGFVLLAKLLSHGYGGLGRYRMAVARGEPCVARIAALLPPLMLAWSRMDRANLTACIAWLRRTPHPPRPCGKEFSFLEKSTYSTAIAICLFSTLVDLPLNAFIASVMTADPAIRLRVHILCGAIAVYMLMWILGDRYLMAGSALVVDGSAFNVRIAGRLAARIPLAAIIRCEPVGSRAGAWCEQRGVAVRETMTSTPADPPNVMIEIDPAAGVRLSSWQVARNAPRYLFLFVDQPAMLAATLTARRL